MKITFVLPFIGITGGVRSIFTISQELMKKGHNISIIYPIIPSRPYKFSGWKSWSKGFFINLCNREDWYKKEGYNLNIVGVPYLSDKYFPVSDFLVATSWHTVRPVVSAHHQKGIKIYFIMGYEIWGGNEEVVKKTYKFPIHKITTSQWLKKVLLEKVGEEVVYTVPQGVDFGMFYPPKERVFGSKRVLMCYSPFKIKGMDDGIRAYEIARRKIPNLKLVMFGGNKLPGLSVDIEYHRRVFGKELRELYSSCDIFLFPSREEGWGLPPMEAMACKCVLVATNVGGVPEYTIPGKTALVSYPNNPKKLADNLIMLLEDDKKLEEIANLGYQYIKGFSRKKGAEIFEKILTGLNKK
ncbi:MAG: glycosyltransferase family 4 protein [Candidatus Stahlbacteria bacterium]|nr:glycosyltransferase family 4 protein [Candidatus Stahlbacteria bacterium]